MSARVIPETVSVEEPVSVDDNGGALTVDGTVAVSNFPATQPVSGTVEVTNDVGNPLPVSGTVIATGPLTDAQLRATPVPVSGTVAATLSEPISVDDNGASLTVDGTVAVSNMVAQGLTDAQLRATPVPVDVSDTTFASTVADGADVTLGAVADAAVDTDTTGTVSGKLRGIVKLFVNYLSRFPSSLGQKPMATSLAVVVASDQTAIPVSGTMTSNDPGIPDTLGQKARAASLGATLSTEDQATQDAMAASLSVLDDWDESDRAKVNPIVGVAGVAAGSGASSTTTQRTISATDSPDVTSLGIMDDWDESDRAKVNPIAGQAGVQGASGAVSATTQRVVLATDVALPSGANQIGLVKDVIRNDSAATTILLNNGDAGFAAVDLKGRVFVYQDQAIPAGTNNIGDVDVASIAAGTNNIGDVDATTKSASVTPSDGQSNTFRIPADDTASGVLQIAFPFVFNGTGWDKLRGGTDGLTIKDGGNVISVDDAGASLTVDVGTALPAGNANIGDVDVATIAAGTTRIGGTYTVNGQIIDENGTVLTVKNAHLDMTTATTTDIVAAVAAKKIRVLEYAISSNENVTTIVNFARGAGTTRVTGDPLHSLGSEARNWRERHGPSGSFLFETGSGEALRVTQTAATDISIAVTYIEV